MKPIESGSLLIYNNVREKITSLYYTNSQFEDPLSDVIKNAKHRHLKALLTQVNPQIPLYNSLLPFAVSVIEYFFKELFKILVKYEHEAQNLLSEVKIKDLKKLSSISDLIGIQKGELQIEDILADNYTFQNINHINTAYKAFLKIDINSVLAKKKYKRRTLLEGLNDIIERRHWMIHHFIFSTDMNKEKYLEVLKVCDLVIEETLSFVEKTRKVNIRKHSWDSGNLFSQSMLNQNENR